MSRRASSPGWPGSARLARGLLSGTLPTPTTSTPLVRQELAQRGLAPRVMELLKKPNALTCLSLLAVLKVMYENHPHPKVCARGSGAGGGGGARVNV